MSTTYAVIAALTIAANAGVAAADLAGARFVRANAAEVGVRPPWIPVLAALKAAGALGLLAGLLGLWHLDVAAAAGLVLFYAGAVAVHLRTRVLHNIAFPSAFLALAAVCCALAVAGV
ncbi:DoxX family protein [Streptomyces andamanensis]|uniref:DoxX family protein n=1 Tax=Streptomyces andamanensis TaxID=1565035 RepID=A0ABV8TQY0_9ACTN